MIQNVSQNQSLEQVAAREILQAEVAGDAIKFYEFAHNDFPNVNWTVYGDCRLSQIALVASIGDFAVGIAETSRALFPPMKDRLFGMPPEDHELVRTLLSKLILCCCGELQDRAA
jgi:hypothetical protein